MQYGQRYKILRTDQSIVEGEYIQTKGDDENYPTFVLEDGSRLGVHHSAVLGETRDDCPVDGIERPTIEHEHDRPEIYTTRVEGHLDGTGPTIYDDRSDGNFIGPGERLRNGIDQDPEPGPPDS